VFSFVGDKGACLLPRGPIYITHWGLQAPWDAMLRVRDPRAATTELWCHSAHHSAPEDALLPFSMARSMARMSSWLNRSAARARPCACPRDLIVPPALQLHVGRHYKRSSWRSSWRCQLFFAGTNRRRLGSHCANETGSRHRCYSQGVRASMFAHHSGRRGFCLYEHLPSRNHSQLMHSARFCLAPNGEGFGNRLSLAIEAGCVPVIIQPEVMQPLHDILPYPRFSLRYGADAIPSLHERLAQVSDSQHAALRRGAAKAAAAFSWADQIGGRAYEYVRFALCLRAGGGCDHLRPAGLALTNGSASSGDGNEARRGPTQL